MKYKRRTHAESRHTSSGLCAGGIESELLGLTLQGGGNISRQLRWVKLPITGWRFQACGQGS
jgi:hypothetical protein